MIPTDGTAQNPTWPLPKFRFSVDFGTEMLNVAFQEVSGLESETQVIEYRDSNSPAFSTVQMPGLVKYGNVTMKRGIFVNDTLFWDWYNKIKMNTIDRKTVIIKLLDERDGVVVQWSLMNAWPTKISSTDLKSDGNEIAIDTIELAHEQIIITQ